MVAGLVVGETQGCRLREEARRVEMHLRAMFEDCWDHNPMKRWSAEKIVEALNEMLKQSYCIFSGSLWYGQNSRYIYGSIRYRWYLLVLYMPCTHTICNMIHFLWYYIIYTPVNNLLVYMIILFIKKMRGICYTIRYLFLFCLLFDLRFFTHSSSLLESSPRSTTFFQREVSNLHACHRRFACELLIDQFRRLLWT